MKNKLEPLLTNRIYHIYNRANGNELLFKNPSNYHHFLSQYKKYIQPISETFCYCLMPNHFHFLIKIKNEEEITNYIQQHNPTLTGFKTLSGLEQEKFISNFISRQFSHLFNGYAQAYNKENKRKGTLFMRPFKRIKVDDELYLRKLVNYIHFNPSEAGLCQNIQDWEFTSFNEIVKNNNSILRNKEVINWFDDFENFLNFHQQPISV